MNKKNVSHSKSEYYTNLMLLTVLEALLLLVFQLAVFNASAIISMYPPIWKYILPFLFFATSVLAVVFIILTAAKPQKRQSFLPLAKFFVYFALMTCIMRYIPNQQSVEVPGRYFVNFERGQKIAGITSVVYIAVSFVYFLSASYIADKKAAVNKPKQNKKK